MTHGRDLTELAEGVIVRDMLTIERAIADFLADCRARRWSERSIKSYGDTLYRFSARFAVDTDITRITADEIRRYRAVRQRHLSPNTIAGEEAHIAAFTKWLTVAEKIRRNPMDLVKRTKRVAPEDLQVKTIASEDVVRLLAEARPGPEKNAVAIPAYLGPRRHAIALLRLSDWDRSKGTITFREKGQRAITKPVPHELAEILDGSVRRGEIAAHAGHQPADPYLVPPEASLRRPGDRDDRVIWRLIKNVAGRAGIDTHVHALRSAFAVFYAESTDDDEYGLRKLLGHKNPAATQVYLRRRDDVAAMERVRTLSWRTLAEELDSAPAPPTPFDALPVVGAGGFEPPFESFPLVEPQCSEHPLVADLLERVHAPDTDAEAEQLRARFFWGAEFEVSRATRPEAAEAHERSN